MFNGWIERASRSEFTRRDHIGPDLLAQTVVRFVLRSGGEIVGTSLWRENLAGQLASVEYTPSWFSNLAS